MLPSEKSMFGGGYSGGLARSYDLEKRHLTLNIISSKSKLSLALKGLT